MTRIPPEEPRDQDDHPRTGKVLVVEDDPLLRRILTKILQTWGYAILEAPDGLSALEHIRAEPPEVSLILLDIMLPLLNGLEVARHVREEQPSLPIVACSAALTDEIKDDLLRLGVNLFLPKPYTPEALRTVLVSLLGSEANAL
jgi:CheY-like chemotaxis protein